MDSPNTSELTILSLATEIIEIIAGEFLEPQDIYSLRTTCHALKSRTSLAFSKTFATLSSNLSLKSLQRLEEISKHDSIKAHVKCLSINHPQSPSGLCEGFSWKRHPSGHLIAPFPAIPTLGDLLLNAFTNCRSFRIVSYCCGPTHFKDLDCIMGTDIIALFFHMLSATEITPKSFELDFQGLTAWGHDTKRLQFTNTEGDIPLYWTPKFLESWAKLQELKLNYGIMAPETERWPREIVTHATNLRKLSLKLGGEAQGFMEKSSLLEPAYPKLEELDISSTGMSSETLLKILSRYKNTLRTIRFYLIYLKNGTDTWPSIFREMASNLPVLESIDIRHLRGGEKDQDDPRLKAVVYPMLEEERIVPGTDCELLDLVWKPRTTRIVGLHYRGPFVKEVLGRLADTAELWERPRGGPGTGNTT